MQDKWLEIISLDSEYGLNITLYSFACREKDYSALVTLHLQHKQCHTHMNKESCIGLLYDLYKISLKMYTHTHTIITRSYLPAPFHSLFALGLSRCSSMNLGRNHIVLRQHAHQRLHPGIREIRAEPRTSRQATRPDPIGRAAKPAAKPAFALDGRADNLARKDIRVHGEVFLRELVSLEHHVLDWLVDGALGQGAVELCGEVGLDGAGVGNHDADIKGLELEAQGARVGCQGALGGRVAAGVEVGDDAGNGGDLEDEAAGGDEQRDKGLDHGHDGKDVGLEHGADVVEVNVGGGHVCHDAAIKSVSGVFRRRRRVYIQRMDNQEEEWKKKK